MCPSAFQDDREKKITLSVRDSHIRTNAREKVNKMAAKIKVWYFNTAQSSKQSRNKIEEKGEKKAIQKKHIIEAKASYHYAVIQTNKQER